MIFIILTKEMKLTTKLIAITLMLATATLAAGECTKDKCGYCAATTNAAAKYCKECVGAAIFGAADARTCVGGTAITGCKHYKNTDDTANGKPYCATCDTAGGYQLVVVDAGDKTKNICVKPITGCKTALSATECTTCADGYYKKVADKTCATITATNCVTGVDDKPAECATCKAQFVLKADKTCAAMTVTNCAVGVADKPAECTTCNDKYYIKTDKTCASITATNCKTGVLDKPAECSVCDSGYVLKADKTCAAITVTNCSVGVADKPAECTTCKTGFVLKKDKTKCDALPTGCAVAYSDADIKCEMCDIAGSYYATDVKGTAVFNNGTDDHWDQVCTKTVTPGGGAGGSSSQIVAVSVMILAMISNF